MGQNEEVWCLAPQKILRVDGANPSFSKELKFLLHSEENNCDGFSVDELQQLTSAQTARVNGSFQHH